MSKKVNCLAAICFALMISSCSVVKPYWVTNNPIGKKVGSATATYVFGLCFGGDAGAATAARNGGITKIATLDVKRTNVLGIVTTFETIVTGE